jgi:hypothetical protein
VVDEAVATFRVVVPCPETEVGVNEALAPEGKPLTEKLTVLEKPFEGVIVTV